MVKNLGEMGSNHVPCILVVRRPSHPTWAFLHSPLPPTLSGRPHLDADPVACSCPIGGNLT